MIKDINNISKNKKALKFIEELTKLSNKFGIFLDDTEQYYGIMLFETDNKIEYIIGKDNQSIFHKLS